MKLGKLNPKTHPNTLDFARYLTGELTAPAKKVYREYKVPDHAKRMFGNDRIGDCTCAGAANDIILKTCHTGICVVPTDDEVIGLYSTVTGYKPGYDSTDNGASMIDILDYLQVYGLAGHKILAWAKIDHTNLEHRHAAVDLFGSTYLGVQLPASAQEQFGAGKPWEVVENSEIEGGHCILHPGYGSEGGDYVTWARWDQKASAAWEEKYIDEEYVIITQDWINQTTLKTPGGLDLAALTADLGLLRG